MAMRDQWAISPRNLTNTRRRTQKEALAVVLGVKHFEVYVTGSSQSVVVYSDHNLVFPC